MIFWAGALTHKNLVEIQDHHTFATISRDFSNNTGGTFVHQGWPVLCIIMLANVRHHWLVRDLSFAPGTCRTCPHADIEMPLLALTGTRPKYTAFDPPRPQPAVI
jgi:hypothetical protein